MTNILGLTNQEVLMRARADLRLGVPIVLAGSKIDVVVAAIDVLRQSRLDQLKSIDENSFVLITARRAETLKCPVYDGNFARLETEQAPKVSSLKAIADPSLDLRNPLKGPFNVIREKPLNLENEALLLLKSAQLLPAAIISQVNNGENFASKYNLTYLQTKQLKETAISPTSIADAITAEIPTARAEKTRFHIFRPNISGEDHYVIEIGKINRDKPILARIHSACFTGDVLGSLKCDCGPQLHSATKMMSDHGGGCLLYTSPSPRDS